MREVLLQAVVNQVRYPNPITFYFTGLLKFLLTKITDEMLQEQILEYLTNFFSNFNRVVVDRLIAEIPRPWGIMYMFVELLRETDSLKKKNYKLPDMNEKVKYLFKIFGKSDGSDL
jgi:hypothetical protein